MADFAEEHSDKVVVRHMVWSVMHCEKGGDYLSKKFGDCYFCGWQKKLCGSEKVLRV